jgi:glutamine amidotransferase
VIAIIDYGLGNLFSLKSSLDYIGRESVVTNDRAKISAADKIILPGVGAFGDAMQKLRENGLDVFLKKEAGKGKPFLGICLGMQILFEKGYEYGEHEGLGLLRGKVIPLSGNMGGADLKAPHMGWNSLRFVRESSLLKNTPEGAFVYFVHSFYAAENDENLAAYADYGVKVSAVVQSGNIFGTQFHPEKSGQVGLDLLRAF